MKETIYEVLKVVLPAIITGFFTFLITKYTYYKNRPLDKIEIAYNRVYHPLYKIVSNNDTDANNMEKVISKGKIYFDKYSKYIDVSIIRLYNSLCECEKEAK